MATFFYEEGIEVVYYTSNFYHAEKRFFSNQEIQKAKKSLNYELKVLKVLGYYSNVSPRRVMSNLFFSLNIFFIFLFKVSRRDKVLLPSRPVELIFFIALIKIFKGVKIYLDIQDIWPDALKIENKRKKKLFEVYCNIFLRPSLRYYTNTLHVAPSFKVWLRRYTKKTPSVFIPLGWENQRWENIHKKKRNNTETLKLVCVSQLQHQIDVMPILKTLRTRKDLHFTIIGEDGTGERFKEVTDYIKNNGLDNVSILGKVKREDMKNHLVSMDIGVLPMITSSIPNKIFDYLASELPIIVLGKNDSANFVIENNLGWACNYNSASFTDIISNISNTDLNSKTQHVKEIKKTYSRDRLHLKIKELILK